MVHTVNEVINIKHGCMIVAGCGVSQALSEYRVLRASPPCCAWGFSFEFILSSTLFNMFAGLFILLVLVNGIVCGGANRGSRYNLEVVRGSRGISQMQQLIPHQASKQVHVDDESTVSDTRFEDHEDKVTSGTRIQKNRINGNDRAWFSRYASYIKGETPLITWDIVDPVGMSVWICAWG
ncbi:hypothetical protein AWENTII_004146 [Aspergillus wentii]